MITKPIFSALLISLFSLLLLGFKPLVPAISPLGDSPGGDTTVHLRQPSFVEPANNLSRLRQQEFYIGRSFFRAPWVIAPSATQDRDGLGPLFNARSCSSCHTRGGRGQTPANSTAPMLALLLRLSLPGKDQKKGVVPEPTYGDQLQVRGISVKNNFGLARKNGTFEGDGIIGEAHAYIEYSTLQGHFTDGENWVLRKPTYKIRATAWGDMHPHTLISPRLAPSLAGLGLLEAIDEKDILALADPDDKNNDGISGRAN
ncbi:MAG: thiol oxidoreductase, partial [Gammaproteobacteria bacterium]|nr:thiol oxidoreductase [Gammaproteobacteria bacterium]